MITNSKHNTNNEPTTKWKNMHAKVCTEAMATEAQDTILMTAPHHSEVSAHFYARRTWRAPIPFYTMLHKFSKCMHNIHISNTTNRSWKFRQRAIKTWSRVAHDNQRTSFTELVWRNSKLMAHLNLMDQIHNFIAKVHLKKLLQSNRSWISKYMIIICFPLKG